MARNNKSSTAFQSIGYVELTRISPTQVSAARGIVLYAGREVVAFDVDLFAVPLSMWLADQQANS